MSPKITKVVALILAVVMLGGVVVAAVQVLAQATSMQICLPNLYNLDISLILYRMSDIKSRF